ncbi:serine hydrolase [Tepidamorphus sp. 3E244]|uniref:serine hydrolase n=1 Tax=Tepidamorphus sp. 3E244 TaxID=3385498 RepID=UPI0038FC4CF6
MQFTAVQAAPKYVSIAIDGNTGEILQSTRPDTLVHPASLTKIMTLYIVFEELEAGRLSLSDSFTVSKFAASQVPSKLGLAPGSKISVRDAILSLVTKSANDMAVTVAENISGSQTKFAERMTQTAHRLGMKRTVYKNASGLPNDDQVTTARDQATLGQTIQVRFPGYYKFFDTTQFTFKGRKYRNHNRLLGKVKGVDGIKTGYIRASGFNLVSSIRRGDRHVVAVIIGAKSGKSRNAAMEKLLEKAITQAKPRRNDLLLSQAGPIPSPRRNPVPLIARQPAGQQSPVVMASAPAASPAPSAAAAPAAGDKPLVLVPNGRGGFKVAQATMAAPVVATQTQPQIQAPAQRAPASVSQPATQLAAYQPSAVATAAPIPSQPVARTEVQQTGSFAPRITIVTPARVVPAAAPQVAMASAQPVYMQDATAPQVAQPVAQPIAQQIALAQPAQAAPAPARQQVLASARAAEPLPTARVNGDYAIQIGAVPDEQAARKLIALAQLRAGELLAGRSPFTQTVDKNGATLWRARFAGFDRSGAKDACKALQEKDFGCFPIRH